MKCRICAAEPRNLVKLTFEVSTAGQATIAKYLIVCRDCEDAYTGPVVDRELVPAN